MGSSVWELQSGSNIWVFLVLMGAVSNQALRCPLGTVAYSVPSPLLVDSVFLRPCAAAAPSPESPQLQSSACQVFCHNLFPPWSDRYLCQAPSPTPTEPLDAPYARHPVCGIAAYRLVCSKKSQPEFLALGGAASYRASSGHHTKGSMVISPLLSGLDVL